VSPVPTCPSLRPAAAIANAYWSTISCSKSSTSATVRNTRGEPMLRTVASLMDNPVRSTRAFVDYLDRPSGVSTNAR
jgi:hypothetical protein